MGVEGNAEDGGGESKAAAQGNTKSRSETQYPYFGLSKAIEIAGAVQKVAGNGTAPATEVMSHLGITSKTDRVWAYGTPATIQFGLIERIGRGDDAKLKLTALGMRIMLPGSQGEAAESRLMAFKTPELYSKLLDAWAGQPVPPKESLKNILQRDYKIVESMAGNAADAFLDSLTAAGLVTAANTVALSDGKGAPAAEKPGEGKKAEVGPKEGTQIIEVPADFIIYKCKISKGRVIEVPLPPDFTDADVARLHAFLKTQVDDAEQE